MVCSSFSVLRSTFRRGRTAAALAATALLLAACGGGGGGGEDQPTGTQTFTQSPTSLPPSTSVAGMCTADGPKQFVRSYMDEVYLWYDEIPQVDASRYSSADAYFDALLVRTPDANGLPKDRFSVALTSSAADTWLSADLDAPQQSLAAGAKAVPVVKVVASPAGRKTGYIQFDDHNAGAQDELIAAFQQMRDQQVADLVLDMRYNSGGYLYVAAAAASMVAAPATEGLVFEKLRYNNKRPADTADSFVLFSSRVQVGETQYARGSTLPQLGLPRLYVLSSSLTCSASESIINGLRGIGIDVVLVGGTTCGKPYGFRRKDNCGMAYFPIEFQGVNAKDFGDYSTGFQANCKVAGDNTKQMGNPDEPLLAAALHHIDTGSCPATSDAAMGVQLSTEPVAGSIKPSRPPWAGRLLAPQQ